MSYTHQCPSTLWERLSHFQLSFLSNLGFFSRSVAMATYPNREMNVKKIPEVVSVRLLALKRRLLPL